jgi:hypothetical protein
MTQTESIPGIRDSTYGRRSTIATEFTVTLEHRPGHEELGLPYEEQEILTVTMPDRPGQLGDFAEMLGEADINIETIFVIDTASGFTELAIAVDNIEKAKTLPLGQF